MIHIFQLPILGMDVEWIEFTFVKYLLSRIKNHEDIDTKKKHSWVMSIDVMIEECNHDRIKVDLANQTRGRDI